jgi:hypothetical protein
VAADGLAGRICAAAADAARSQYMLLELIGQFDAMGRLKHWTGFKSVADWLSWACSMTPQVAREHVGSPQPYAGCPASPSCFKRAGCRIRRSGR